MDFPILPVEVGVLVGCILDNSEFLDGWLRLNGQAGMRTVGGDIEDGDEIDDHGGDQGKVNASCCMFSGIAGGSPVKILLVV